MGKLKKDKSLIARDGTVLTDEVIEELVAEAERGYDLSKLEPVGRPSLSGSGTSPRLSFRIEADAYDAARKRADEEGLSISELAREAITRYLAS
jgi:hypothetical protein